MLEMLLPKLSGFEILESAQRRENLAFIRVPKAQLFSLLGLLKQQYGWISLDQISCTDWMEEGFFTLGYMLENAERSQNLSVQIQITREGERMESLIPLWPQAEIFEREIHEMFGVPFEGHPTLGDFMLEGWAHMPPMRRDFDTLQFVEENFVMREGREDNLDVKVEVKRIKEEKKRLKELEEAQKAAEESSQGDSSGQ